MGELASRQPGGRGRLPTLALVLVFAVLGPLALFGALASRVAGGSSFRWDDHVLRVFESYYDLDLAVVAAKAYLALGMALGGVLGVVLLLMLLARRRWLHAAFWIVSLGGALALTAALKDLFHRPPLGSHGGGYSFPSGNAAASTAAVVAIVLLLPPLRLRLAALVVGAGALFAYGLALVFLGWHYPSDVVGGWCLGTAWPSVLWVAVGPSRPWPRAALRRR